MADTNEQAAQYVQALTEELRFATHNLNVHEADEDADPKNKAALEERVQNIKDELARVSQKAKAPARRAERR